MWTDIKGQEVGPFGGASPYKNFVEYPPGSKKKRQKTCCVGSAAKNGLKSAERKVVAAISVPRNDFFFIFINFLLWLSVKSSTFPTY